MTAHLSCATKVKARYMAPARFDVAGIHTLAVAEFESQGFASSRWASYIRDRVEEDLGVGGFYGMRSGAPEVGADASHGGDGDYSWRRWGRAHDADAILGGAVSADVEEERETKREEREVGTGRYRNEYYTEGGVKRVRRVEIKRKEIEYVLQMERIAEMEVAVALLDTKTAIRLEHELYSESNAEDAEGEDDIRRMQDANDMLRELADRIIPQIVNDLKPHAVVQSIALASCDECKEGMKLAKDDEWDAAIASWRAAAASDSDNHAALYNLGVAAEVAGDYAEADRYYLNALEIDGKRFYRKALERVDKRMEANERLKGQMEGR